MFLISRCWAGLVRINRFSSSMIYNYQINVGTKKESTEQKRVDGTKKESTEQKKEST